MEGRVHPGQGAGRMFVIRYRNQVCRDRETESPTTLISFSEIQDLHRIPGAQHPASLTENFLLRSSWDHAEILMYSTSGVCHPSPTTTSACSGWEMQLWLPVVTSAKAVSFLSLTRSALFLLVGWCARQALEIRFCRGCKSVPFPKYSRWLPFAPFVFNSRDANNNLRLRRSGG